MIPLTPTLLDLRIAELRARVEDEHGPADETIFQRIACDECGFVYDLLDITPPVGWTTEGDLVKGFRDYCRACSLGHRWRW